MISLVLLSACSCRPDLPHPVNEGDVTKDPDDSGDIPSWVEDSGDVDTAPPPNPRCTYEISEDDDPDNDFLEQYAVPLDTWACGFVDRVNDLDTLTFTTTMPGWLEVAVEAQSRSSSANMQNTLSFLTGDESTLTGERYGGSDPLNVFYAPLAGNYLAILTASNTGSGEAYGWWFIARVTKPPVDLDTTEQEPNDAPEQGLPMDADTRYFGTFGEPADSDWYVIDVPADATSITYETDAFEFGSAADPNLEFHWGGEDRMFIYTDSWDDWTESVDARGEFDIAEQIDIATDLKATSPDLFPHDLDFTRLYVRAYDGDDTRGSMFRWYVFWISFETGIK